jgi:two-component system cell cycle sensor histidine kinase/response regulator CckA
LDRGVVEEADALQTGTAFASFLLPSGILASRGECVDDRAEKTVKLKSGPRTDDHRYASLFEQSPYCSLLIDAEGNFLDFNTAAHHGLGYSREEFAKLRLADIVDPGKYPDEIRNGITGVENRGEAGFETTHRARDGSLREVRLTAKTISLSGQQVLYVVWHDITENKKTEDALKEANTRLETLIHAMPDIVILKDACGRYMMVNRSLEEQTGWKRDQFIGKTNNELLPPNIAEMCNRSDAEAIRSGRPIHADEQSVDKDGGVQFLDTIKAPLYDRSGDLAGLLCVARDVTDRKKAEEALRQSEERFRLAMLGANDGLWDWDLKTDKVYYSPRWKAMLGYAGGELESNLETWKRLVHSDDKGPTLVAVDDYLSGRTDKFEVEFRMRHKDGYYLDILSRAFLAHDADGVPLRLVGTHVDITDRKRTAETLRRNEELMRDVLDNVDQGFLVIDREFRIVTANRAYAAWSGKEWAKIRGRHCYEISHQATLPCFEQGADCAVKRAFETGEPSFAMHKHSDAKGNILFFEMKAFPLRDSSGTVTSAIETIHNITEKHLREAELLKTQKLEAIGTVAGGIAHDFNNLLQGVFGFISLAKLAAGQPERSLAALEEAEKALHMSINLTSQLLTFSKGGRPVMKPVSLKSAIKNAAKFALSGSRSEHSIVIKDDLWHVEADEGQIGQVIQNIVLNADQAMPEGGRVEIWAGNEEIAQGVNPLLPAGGRFVKVVIKDSGVGIPEHHLPKIFDPYFTTKQKGSGLGLATTYSIVRNHGGMINVNSEIGKGSSFSVYLAACDEEAKKVPPPAVSTGRPGKVLVLDDEETVRIVIAQMLESLGHEVAVAEEGAEAITKYREAKESGAAFDIAILDLTIRGGMGGTETVRRLSQIDPGVKAVVSSGYSDNPIVSEYWSHGFAASLSKPYTIDSLRDCLNSLLPP